MHNVNCKQSTRLDRIVSNTESEEVQTCAQNWQQQQTLLLRAAACAEGAKWQRNACAEDETRKAYQYFDHLDISITVLFFESLGLPMGIMPPGKMGVPVGLRALSNLSFSINFPIMT